MQHTIINLLIKKKGAVPNDNDGIVSLLQRQRRPPVDGHSPLSVSVAYDSLECAKLLKEKFLCDGDDCIETNQGQEIFIDLSNSSPEMKDLFLL